MERFDAIIIGAGPSGLFCATEIAASGASVLVLEKNTRAGKKLLITGSGKCNITNMSSQDVFEKAYGTASRFVQPSLRQFSNIDLIGYLEEHGVPTIEAHDGKVFPKSMKASDLVALFLKRCSDLAVSIRYNEPCSAIQRTGDGFLCESPNAVYSCAHLVIATGGASYPVTGSTGDGYALAQSLGHTVVQVKPSLSPVRILHYDFVRCAGLAIPECEVSLVRSGKKIGSRVGDVLFTHTGLSGPGILDFSRSFQQGDEITLRLLPSFSSSQRQELDLYLLDICKKNPKKLVRTIIREIGLADSLVVSVLLRLAIPLDQTCALLSKNSRTMMTQVLLSCQFSIQAIEGFSVAMATSGGISLKEVQSKTMESTIVPHLYFAGEVLDVDGDTGGYNIQFAFSSAFLVALSIKRAKM